MAEGGSFGASPTPSEDLKPWYVRLGRWLSLPRVIWSLVAAGAIAGLLVGALLWHAFAAPILGGAAGAAYFAAGCALLMVPLLCLGLDSTENAGRGPGLTLPVTTLLPLVGVAAFVAADSILGLRLINLAPGPQTSGQPPPVFVPGLAATLAFVTASFFPRIVNAIRLASLERGSNGHAGPSDNESLAALVVTILVVGISTAAFFLGTLGDAPNLSSAVGIGISVAVVGAFIAFVLFDSIAASTALRRGTRMLHSIAFLGRPLAKLYEAVDGVLVRVGAHVAGQRHHHAASRYLILASTLCCLCLIGWFLPAPWGLLPASMGFVIALSVSRLWAWVEDDRSLAAITNYGRGTQYKVGLTDDFKDETLLGFAFVLALLPIMLMQAHVGKLFGVGLFEPRGGTLVNWGDFSVWLGYFGFELAKALPVVDWADIYQLQAGEDQIVPLGGAGRHVVFAARVMVDIVLVASLLQAINVATRNRQQKALYAAGQIRRLDELVERRELNRAVRYAPSLDDGAMAHHRLVDFREYDFDRLRELHESSDREDVRDFIKLIFEKADKQLSRALVVLTKMAPENTGELYRTLDRAIDDHVTGVQPMSVGDIVEVFDRFRSVAGLRDFKFRLMDLAGSLGEPDEACDLFATLSLSEKSQDGFKYGQLRALEHLRTMIPSIRLCETATEILRMAETTGRERFGERHAILMDVTSKLNDVRARLCAPTAA